MRAPLLCCFLAFLALTSGSAAAHKPSDSYLTLSVTEEAVAGRWDIALRDLDHAIGLDSDGDGAITWGELRGRHTAIAAYALSHLDIMAGQAPCGLEPLDHLVADHSDGGYAVLRFTANCPQSAGPLGVAYSLFFELDPQHRGLLQLERGSSVDSAIFSPAQPALVFHPGEARVWRQMMDYLLQGIWHIWIGFDHVLFLLTLLLPAVLRRGKEGWQPVPGFHAALLSVVKIVTAFTLAHSITLSLAALEVIALPSGFVESVIAASVLIAAANNVFPLVTRRLWLVAFGFGLVHGFGFASVLADLGLPTDALLLSLLGFNLGVEAGQLAIVAGFLPLIFLLRVRPFYSRVAVPLGSLAIAATGGLWFAERAFDLTLPVL